MRVGLLKLKRIQNVIIEQVNMKNIYLKELNKDIIVFTTDIPIFQLFDLKINTGICQKKSIKG